MPALRTGASNPIRACGRHPSAPARNLHFERTFCVPPIMAQKTGLLPYKSPYGNGFSTSERFRTSPPPSRIETNSRDLLPLARPAVHQVDEFLLRVHVGFPIEIPHMGLHGVVRQH